MRSKQRRPAGRRRRRARPRRAGPPRRAVSREMGFHTVGIAAARRRRRWPAVGRGGLPRQPGPGPGGGTSSWADAKVILATATSGDAMTAVQGGLAVNGTLLVVGAAALGASVAIVAADGMPLGQRLVFRNVDRLGGYAQLQCACWRVVDERTLSAGACRRSLRADDERQRAFSRGAHDGPLATGSERRRHRLFAIDARQIEC